jgi:NADH dehydrogenase
MAQVHRVVIVGGGFGGLSAALAFKRARVEVTLIDRRNFHLFQPLLYQVATGGLSPANIAAPLRSIVKRQANCSIIMDNVQGFDIQNRQVILNDRNIPFDSLIVAAGAGNNFFAHPEWEEHATGLKSIEEATEIRRRVLTAFENAEETSDPARRERFMTFVVVGGGATGVEMAGAISELARHTLHRDFRKIDPSKSRILIVEGSPNVLGVFPDPLPAKAEKALQKMGVEIWTSSKVMDIQADHVQIDRGGTRHRIETSMVVWGAGVKASPLGKLLADATGATTDRGGRVVVQPNCSLPSYPNIFVIGDMASITSNGKPVPGVAPAAMQMGRFVARTIRMKAEGRNPTDNFVYYDKGSMATIGRNAAVVSFAGLKMSGFIAWTAWLFVHLMYLVNFSNRILVLFQWFWSYITRNRSARLITGETAQQKAVTQPGA